MATTFSHTNSGINQISIIDGAGNVIGIDAQQVNVPAPANLIIPGGSNGHVLSTDGAGNLYWAAPGSGQIISPFLEAGNSNVRVAEDANITFSSAGAANVLTVTSSGIQVSGKTTLPAIANVKIGGGYNDAIMFSNGSGGLRWGGDYLLPESGAGWGWLIANGLRLYRSGTGISTYVASWRTNSYSWRPLSVSVLHDDMPTITSWQKIHMNEVCLYALGDNGVLYSQGVDTEGQQGNTSTNVTNEVLTPITHPTLYGAGISVLNFWSYDKVYATNLTSGAVCVNVNDNGTLKTYMFGANFFGEQGNGTATTANQVPTLITQLNGKTISNVSFYAGMIVVVTSSGEVWGCGNNLYGQLGLNTTTSVSTFSRATKSDGSFFTNASSVLINWTQGASATTGVATFILCSDGTLWASGYNNGTNRELGLNTTVTNITRFEQVPISNTIVKIGGNSGRNVALDSLGNLWSWSRNDDGFWGSGGENELTILPKIIQPYVSDFWMISVPGDPQAYSLVWRDTQNRTWGTGINNSRQLGVTAEGNPVVNPTPVPFRTDDEYPIQVISLGLIPGLATMWLTNKQRVYISGTNVNAGSIVYASNQSTNQVALRTPMEITNIL